MHVIHIAYSISFGVEQSELPDAGQQPGQGQRLHVGHVVLELRLLDPLHPVQVDKVVRALCQRPALLGMVGHSLLVIRDGLRVRFASEDGATARAKDPAQLWLGQRAGGGERSLQVEVAAIEERGAAEPKCIFCCATGGSGGATAFLLRVIGDAEENVVFFW